MPADLLSRCYRTFVLLLLHFKRLERLHSKFCLSNSETFLHASLTERRRYHVAVQVYRILHKLSPPYLRDTFHYAVNITSHIGQNLRHLFVPRVRTKERATSG